MSRMKPQFKRKQADKKNKKQKVEQIAQNFINFDIVEITINIKRYLPIAMKIVRKDLKDCCVLFTRALPSS